MLRFRCLVTARILVYAGTIIESYKTKRGNIATVEAENIHKNRIGVTVNGKEITQDTWYANRVTYAPIREVANMLGASVEYNSVTQSADIVTEYDVAFATKSLEVKSSPGLPYETLGVIAPGTEVKVIGGVPIGYDQYDFSTAEQYGWSRINYNGQTGWVITHELNFADPYNWAPGIKEVTINEIKSNYVSENDEIRLEVYGDGFYVFYIQFDGTGEWFPLVYINPKTGWYHG